MSSSHTAPLLDLLTYPIEDLQNYNRQFRGQLIPYLDFSSIPSTHTVLQTGPYRSLWIRLTEHQDELDPLDTLIENCIDTITSHGGIYIGIQESILWPEMTLFLKEKGFKFYTYHEETTEFFYYLWVSHDLVDDLVPVYATSIEGAMGVCLSPDETEVLLVHEYGCWKGPGGAVDHRESAIEGVIREVKEETNLTVDTSISEKLVLVWNFPQARDKLKNDNFYIFALRVLSKDELQLDGNELSRSKWIPVSELQEIINSGFDETSFLVELKGEKYYGPFLSAIKNYLEGKYFLPHLEQHKGNQTKINYF
eukprot:TRINITY_DN13660_c0_g1_i1.p1 TRINITY_DN13660_c0_g1~~TRINITY_DN13660_c0_g1_i1.p1  ORF type:complete len:309 (+),score=46.25 TRINITY_DN13660_c0_g1_i1:63-989(+)